MTNIDEVIDPDLLAVAEAQGYVRRRLHPEFPELAILNYTEKAAYEGVWNEATLNSRGLIYNVETFEVLARPFAKFFNYGQAGAPEIDLDAQVYWVGDKADGSLGIGYIRPDGKPAIATRGSFESEQAIHATENLTDYDANRIRYCAARGVTVLFEIVYPENRIVLDYGDRDELILLGTVLIDDGAYLPPDDIDSQIFWSLGTVLAQPPRPNAEGYVVWLDPHTAVKIKQQDYIELHRIVTGLNRKSIWRALKDDTYGDLIEKIPDELFNWAEEVALELTGDFEHIVEVVRNRHNDLRGFQDQKSFALAVQAEAPKEQQGLVFAMRAGKDISEKVWNMIEPKGGER